MCAHMYNPYMFVDKREEEDYKGMHQTLSLKIVIPLGWWDMGISLHL